MCCALKHRRHCYIGRAHLNTFTMTIEAEMFGLIIAIMLFRQMKILFVNVEVL